MMYFPLFSEEIRFIEKYKRIKSRFLQYYLLNQIKVQNHLFCSGAYCAFVECAPRQSIRMEKDINIVVSFAMKGENRA